MVYVVVGVLRNGKHTSKEYRSLEEAEFAYDGLTLFNELFHVYSMIELRECEIRGNARAMEEGFFVNYLCN